MSQEKKTLHPVGRAALAIAALVVIVAAGNILVASLGIGHKALDLTENKVHSLSDGTKKILEELAAPVVIRYYATRSTDYMPEELKLHMRRVDDLLAEYESVADGKLQVENLDPEPDTDAEDAANLDGIRGQQINDQNLYFGLAISCLDRTTTIPFLDPRDETMLEYRVSRAIAEVSAARKPKIAVMSALPVAGGPAMMPGQQGQRPWVVYEQLQQSYEVEDIGMSPAEIDPDEYSLVLLIHPAQITPEAEFAIDQYVLQGGTVIACLDPFSVTAQMTGGGNPMMGQAGTPTSSTLPTLLETWGVQMDAGQVVGDSTYQTSMQGNRTGLAVLTVPQQGMPQEDSILTRELASVTLFLPGGFTKPGGSGVAMETLVRSTSQSALIASMPASRLDPNQLVGFRPDDKTYDLVLHLKGRFKSAFPDGKPGEEPPAEEGDDDADAANEEDGEEETGDAAPESLTEASAEGNVFLISDVDAFYDNFAYSMQRLGNMQFAQPINGNSALLFNLVDQAASSTHLIGSRSRAATRRPFVVFNELEAETNREQGAKIAEFEEEMQEAQQRINELQRQKTQGTELYLSPEQESELKKLREQEVSARQQIRELQKDLRRKKDAISARIITWNLAGMPLLVVLAGIGFFAARRRKTRAR